MTAVRIRATRPRLPGRRRAGALLASLGLALGATACSTSAPKPLSESALVEAQTFPYYRLYWAGPRFEQWPIAAVDGTANYLPLIGSSVYYGDCVSGKGNSPAATASCRCRSQP